MQVLLFWAAQNSRKIQQSFVSYWNKTRSAYQSSEISSGVFEGERLITSDGMQQMIWSFEKENDLEKTDFVRWFNEQQQYNIPL